MSNGNTIGGSIPPNKYSDLSSIRMKDKHKSPLITPEPEDQKQVAQKPDSTQTQQAGQSGQKTASTQTTQTSQTQQEEGQNVTFKEKQVTAKATHKPTEEELEAARQKAAESVKDVGVLALLPKTKQYEDQVQKTNIQKSNQGQSANKAPADKQQIPDKDRTVIGSMTDEQKETEKMFAWFKEQTGITLTSPKELSKEKIKQMADFYEKNKDLDVGLARVLDIIYGK